MDQKQLRRGLDNFVAVGCCRVCAGLCSLAGRGFNCICCTVSSVFDLLSFQQHDACVIVHNGASQPSSWHSSLPVAKGRARLSECVAAVEGLRRLKQSKCYRLEEKKQLEDLV